MSSRSKRILDLARQCNRQSEEVDNQVDIINRIETEDDQVDQIHENHTDYEDLDPYSSDDSVLDKTYVLSSGNTSSSDGSFESSSDLENQVSHTPISSSASVGAASDNSDNEWHDVTTHTLGFDFFSEACTLRADINVSTVIKPIDIFDKFITEELLDIITLETNNYAQQELNKRHSNKSRMKSWTNTTNNEIRAFLGVTLAMGLTQVPSLNLYWSKDKLFHNQFISSVMSRDRYFLLLKFLHFVDNSTADTTNRLYKIENILSKLISNYQDILQPGKILVIDESMVPFRGRLHFRQYIPNKTHKYGVKLYKLCSPEGYTFNVNVYCGKNDKDNTQENVGHSQAVVLKLLRSVNPKQGRILYADNFYSSPALVERLYKENMLYCGTLRSNRKGVPAMNEKLKRGEIVAREKNFTRVIKWMDKRPVLMISSDPSHDSLLIRTDKRNRNGEDILKPKCVLDYNRAKKGVDFSDQMSSYHTVLRRSVKWYR